MNKLITALAFTSALSASPLASNGQNIRLPEGKDIYIPKELQKNDFYNPESKWSFHRMATTPNFVVFWEKGFGDDLAKAPELDGHNMKVDLGNLLDKLESFYAYYRDTLKFVLPGSKSERYRMMVMLNYSLEGTAYGGDYDQQIGALWIAPNRVQDKKLNCIAHELGHSFQSQIGCDGQGESWGGGGIFEMASQWMLWQVNQEWVTDELYHWEGFKQHIYLPFLHGENIYHSPYVLEYWSMKRGLTVMGELFRHGRIGEDPAMTYMRLYNLGLDEMADEMYECYSRLVTFDFPRVKESHRKYACQMATSCLHADNDRIIMPAKNEVPCTYGFNVIELPVDKGKDIKISFEGSGDKNKNGYRYGIVATDAEGNAQYSKTCSAFKGKIAYTPEKDTERMFLVVMGYPKDHYQPIIGNPYEQKDKGEERRFNYTVRVGK
ncbi:MAG: DUF6055 domain-containing protein [Bacteroides sp.]|nr:DUF6055 domain-containing protein [Roseburia sp.]MCM1346938.1 DUF6055 domain-containing protein [Bacteroides sp.]MCM1421517.1 DUF6055 domain-containing protein [Bacteroides sp.]